MAIVVEPRDPFAGLIPGMKAFAEGIDEMVQPKLQKQDMAAIQAAQASGDPEQIKTIGGKLKSEKFTQLWGLGLLQNALQSTQTTSLVSPGGRVVGKVPKDSIVLPKETQHEYINPDTKKTVWLSEGISPPQGFVSKDIYSQDMMGARQDKSLAGIAERQDKSLAAIAERIANKPDTTAQEKTRAVDLRQKMNLGQPLSKEDQAWLDAHEQEAQGGGAIVQFKNWTPEAKEQEFQAKLTGGTGQFGSFDRANKSQFGEEYAAWKAKNGLSGVDEKIIQGQIKADQASVTENEKYLGASGRFLNTMDRNSDLLREMRSKHGTNFGKIFNQAINGLKTGVWGDGDIASIQYAVYSINKEASKLEGGSMGVAEPSVDASKAIANILNYNLNEKDMDRILDTMSQFGQERIKGISDETKNLQDRMRDPAGYGKLFGKKSIGLPADAKAQLKEGVISTFGNGQKWTLQNGKEVQVQ